MPQSKSSKYTRRNFLKTSSAAAIGASISAPAFISAQSPNEKLNVVVIGCGGRGGSNLGNVMGESVVALCDVNEQNLNKASQRVPGAQRFKDYRELYEKFSPSKYDAVVVSTTEHTHAFATMPALRNKKHVYCEKPLTHSVHEARKITEAAKQAGVATQMGTQIHAGNNYRRVVELVQGGAIGNITEAHVWVSRAWGLQSPEDAKKHRDIVSVQDRPKQSMPIPSQLDWDLWIGPAPMRPYHEVYFPGPKWYRWWDFGNGTMSDLGSHWIDLPFWALELDAPTSIDASGPPAHAEIAPASMSAKYEYPARGDRGPLSLTWHQGTSKPDIWTEGKIPQWGNGVLFIGDKGMLLSDYGKHVLLPTEDFADFQKPEPTIPNSKGHHAEWIHACKTGDPTTCHFGYAGPLTEANHLGNVAFRAGKKLVWDSKNMKITNAPEAEQFFGREYRKGWSLEG